MERFVIHGGMPLIGTAAVPAAKNAVVALMAASLLSGSVTELLNIERISDADDMLEILRSLGCDCAWQDSAVRIDSGAAEAPQVPSSRANKIRSSIFLLG
ncbi:MAG: UDP-N-acetylglucosamine 1-carboxyvinyltransferase, partial [Firmicutes bacterium]|nr:UDP-N-acetylglucosamine 1-carboxyvinyltransferase [Bacillota bacterium]